MTPAEIAVLHAASFPKERPWSEQEFACFKADRTCRFFFSAHGFALVRTIAGETELLTIAVHPTARRKGEARDLLTRWLTQSEAETAFLEVASDNAAACALYAAFGFLQVGERKGYYRRDGKPAADALVLRCDLPHGQARVIPRNSSESG